MTDPDRPAAPVVEWHRITTEEDAAADMLFRCGRRDLSNGVSLQAGDLASDTAHVVARGTDPGYLSRWASSSSDAGSWQAAGASSTRSR